MARTRAQADRNQLRAARSAGVLLVVFGTIFGITGIVLLLLRLT